MLRNKMLEVDQKAKERALRLGMPPDVLIPIGARDKHGISKYIGIIEDIAQVSPASAFIVRPPFCPALNKKLPLWKLKESEILHCNKQVWVHVDFKSYRAAYIKACPEEDVSALILDHILNRRVARLKGFDYLPILPVTKGVNTSSGGVTEKYGFAYQSAAHMQSINKESEAFIEYADIADIVKMLNQKTGGKFQDIIRDSLYLLEEE